MIYAALLVAAAVIYAVLRRRRGMGKGLGRDIGDFVKDDPIVQMQVDDLRGFGRFGLAILS